MNILLAVCLAWSTPMAQMEAENYTNLLNRVAALEEYVASQKVERAQIEAKRLERSRIAKERSKADAEHERVNSEFRKWLSDCRSKYGRMTLVDYDTNTCERIYRRVDGMLMRRKCYDDAFRGKGAR